MRTDSEYDQARSPGPDNPVPHARRHRIRTARDWGSDPAGAVAAGHVAGASLEGDLAGITNEALVRQIYGALHSRDPDPEGLKSTVQYLRDNPGADGIGRLLAGVIDSPEVRRNLLPLCLDTFFKGNGIGDGQEQPSAVIGLGGHCYVASFLRRRRLSKASYPFDWVHSNPLLISHCIDDDFRTLLDASYYSRIPGFHDDQHGTDHSYYGSQFSQINMFNHHDLLTSDGYDYLKRCVDRFRIQLEDTQLKLFLHVSLSRHGILQDLEQMVRSLEARTENFSVIAVVVEDELEPLFPSVNNVSERDHLKVYRLRATTRLGPTEFIDYANELLIYRLIRQFDLSRVESLAS